MSEKFEAQAFTHKKLICLLIFFVFVAILLVLQINLIYAFVDGFLVPPKAVLIDGNKVTAVYDGRSYPPADRFVVSVEDARSYEVYYKTKPDASKIGPQKLKIVVKKGIAKAEYDVVLSLLYDDYTKPDIYVEPFEVYVGEAVSYMSYVKVDDACGAENVTVEVDSSKVDITKTGKYPVTYTATDIFGNRAVKTVNVSVKPMPTDTLNEKLDAIISSKGWSKLPSKQAKIKAVFDYLRSDYFEYAGSSDKNKETQEAYRFLTTGTGDCYNYFALAKHFFARLGIETRDVHRARSVNGETHYWLLVKLESGEWYHFDACPQRYRIDSYLMTDAQLDEYERKRGSEYYNFDSSGLPARSTKVIVNVNMDHVSAED